MAAVRSLIEVVSYPDRQKARMAFSSTSARSKDKGLPVLRGRGSEGFIASANKHLDPGRQAA